MGKISIILPYLNKEEMTNDCIRSLLNNTKSEIELITIDDGSEKQNDFASGVSCSHVWNRESRGVTDCWNVGLGLVHNEYVCFLNNDVFVTEGWDIPLVEALDAGNSIASPYHTQKDIPEDWPFGESRHTNGGFPILGCCFVCKKEIFYKIGTFPTTLKLWYNDNWLVWQCRNHGMRMVFCEDSYVHHLYSQTINTVEKLKEITDNDKLEYDKIVANEIKI